MKYYVESGSIREVVVAESPNKAAQKAIRKGIRKNKLASVGMIMRMSDKSFENFLSKEERSYQRIILTSLVLKNMPEFKGVYQALKNDENEMMGKLYDKPDKPL